MTLPTAPLPVVGQANATEDGKIPTAIGEVQGILTAGVDTSNLAASLVSALALGSASRGAFNIPATESRSNTAYGTLATPDQITGLVLPTNGLIVFWYQATWQESIANAGRAAIFVGANQLSIAGNLIPETQAAATNVVAAAGHDGSLLTTQFGLVAVNTQPVSPVFVYGGDVTTGQIVGFAGGDIAYELGGTVKGIAGSTSSVFGGAVAIFAAAGTYTVGVQFKASSGSVTAKNRKGWALVIPFS